MADLLTVQLGDRIIASCDNSMPWQTNVSVEFSGDSLLTFTDSSGKSHLHDLTSATEEGATWIHLSVSVRQGHVVIADCLLSQSEDPPIAAYHKGDADAIRFQPFFLPEREEETPDMSGRGLFHRGFHATEHETPGNVTLSCICDSCQKSFRLISFHAGLRRVSYLYCSENPHTMLAPSQPGITPPIFGPADRAMVARFEARVPPCMICGGAFQYYNPLRCPHCREPYIDFKRFPEEREIECYATQIYNADLQEWAPG